MATGNLVFSPGAASLPDGTSSNLPPAVQAVKSSASAPGVYFLQLAYDASFEEWAAWQFRMPDDYASGPVLKLQYKMTSATTGDVVWDGRLAAVSSGDATDVDAKGFGSANTVTSTVPGTAGYLTEVSITLTNADSVAAGDFVVLRVARAAASGSDTAAGDAELVGCSLAYTTS